jgi:hypothetical protein
MKSHWSVHRWQLINDSQRMTSELTNRRPRSIWRPPNAAACVGHQSPRRTFRSPLDHSLIRSLFVDSRFLPRLPRRCQISFRRSEQYKICPLLNCRRDACPESNLKRPRDGDPGDSPIGHPHPRLPRSRGKRLHFDRRHNRSSTLTCFLSARSLLTNLQLRGLIIVGRNGGSQ